MHAVRLIVFAVLAQLLAVRGATGTVPFSGELRAHRDCSAVSSIKRGTNPGNLRITPGDRYQVLGKNKEAPTHYQIRLDGAEPSERWVEVGCGRLVPAASSVPLSASKPAPPQSPVTEKGPAGAFVLAANWQQAFCEIRPHRPECGVLDGPPREVNMFSLHGLWPQPSKNIYCDVPGNERSLSERGLWRRLPALDLDDATRARLNRAMPGTLSYLHRHEWVKHGTCYGTGEETYYRHSLSLLEQLNRSPVRDLFADHSDRHLSSNRIRETFDKAFGRGAGERVRIVCDYGLITEVQLSLKGVMGEDASLGRLMRQAKRRSMGCRGGRVDAAGRGK